MGERMVFGNAPAWSHTVSCARGELACAGPPHFRGILLCFFFLLFVFIIISSPFFLLVCCFFFSFPAGTGHEFYNPVGTSNVALMLGQTVTFNTAFFSPIPAPSTKHAAFYFISTRWDLSWPLDCFFLHPAPSREKC